MVETIINQEESNIRTWPFFLMFFFQTSSMGIFGLAFRNFLIFIREISPNDVGNILSALPIAYIFGPFLCSFVTNKLKGGVRSSLILSTFVYTSLQGLQLIFTNPFILITIRISQGFLMG